MWINLGADGYAVMDVAAGGPAATAGLAVGDVITSIDGRKPGELSLADARKLLRTTSTGTSVAMTVRRGQTTRRVDVVLRDMIAPHASPLTD
jgi:C-terminal processing protease CtpA/Prc